MNGIARIQPSKGTVEKVQDCWNIGSKDSRNFSMVQRLVPEIVQMFLNEFLNEIKHICRTALVVDSDYSTFVAQTT